MSKRSRDADDLTNLASELGAEDGTDPKEFHEKPWNAPRQAGRKARQLCAQVKDALNGTFAGCAEIVLQGLQAVAVEPAPHSGRLLVVLTAEEPDRSAVEATLSRAAGFLRLEVAAAVSRRYAPELVFEIL
jgi:ribosome-binding factor A